MRRPADQGGVAAVADRCPHRAAALSQASKCLTTHCQHALEWANQHLFVVAQAQPSAASAVSHLPLRATMLWCAIVVHVSSSLQGLLTPEGAIQCAYHGWKFDGGSGECIDIPQLQPGLCKSWAQTQASVPVRQLHGCHCAYCRHEPSAGRKMAVTRGGSSVVAFSLTASLLPHYCRCQVQQAHLRHSVPMHRVPGHCVAQAAAREQRRRSQHSRAPR